ERGQRQVDLHRDPRDIADLDDRAAERVFHVGKAGCERSVERPDERCFDISVQCAPRGPLAIGGDDALHFATATAAGTAALTIRPLCRAATWMPISAAGLGP